MGGPSLAFVFLAILELFTVIGANSEKYTPEKLAHELTILNATEWNVPFLVCVAHLTSNLTTDFVLETESGNFTGIFGLSDIERRKNGCVFSPDVSISSDYACVEKIFVNPHSTMKGSGPRELFLGFSTSGIRKIDINSCIDYWHNLPETRINSTSTETCDKSSGLAVNLLLALVDFLLIFLCFVLFLYVRDQNKIIQS